MKKGVIMDIEREYITMLTIDGEFIKTGNQNKNHQIGDELVFFPLEERSSIKDIFRLSTYKVKWISVLTAILLLISFIPTYLNDDVYAYMSIDINPSFEIGLDRDLQVISIEAMNKDGEIILQQIDQWKNQHVDILAETIIVKSRENGYLNEGQEVIIATVIEEDDVEEEVEANLEEDLSNLTNTYKNENIVITSIKSDGETREKAKKQGLSTGKLIQQEIEKQAEKENKKENNRNLPKKNDDKGRQKQIEKVQHQQKAQKSQKEQKENEKGQNKGNSEKAELKKGNGKEKGKVERGNGEKQSKKPNDRGKEVQQENRGR